MKGRVNIALWGLSILSVLILSAPCFSEGVKFGVGVSATQSDTTVYFPIKIPVKKKFLLIEPMVTHVSTTETDDFSSYVLKNKIHETDIGTGIYLVSGLISAMDLQVGIRFAYVMYEDKTTAYANNASGTALDDKKHGYVLAPVLGLNYNFNDHITVGATVAYTYTRLNSDYLDNTGSTSLIYSSEIEKYSTDTDLFVKYYF